jgi:hypothetical protein
MASKYLPFLTEIDERARVAGSRDPLGMVPIWSRLGRHVIGNLTTVSSSVRGFTTLLLGLRFAQEARETGLSKESTLNLFLKFEQLVGYSRWAVNKDSGFRGIDRVRKRLSEHVEIRISAEERDQILSKQKTYGLWGLYRSAAMASGLAELDAEETIPARAIREFIESEYIAALTKAGLACSRPKLDLEGKHAKMTRCLAELHRSDFSRAEKAFYRRHLVEGGPNDPTGGKQQQLAELLLLAPAEERRISKSTMRALVAEAVKRGAGWEPLAKHLGDIMTMESLLAPAVYVFDFLLSRDAQSLGSVAKELSGCWGRALKALDVEAIGALKPEIAAAYSNDVADRWCRLASAFADSAYPDSLQLCLDHNKSMMEIRGSSAWIQVENGKINVRFRDVTRDLPAGRDVAGLWENTYFLDSLKTVAHTIAN